MTKLAKQLLENIFDSLDRLFDRECRVIDLYALLFVSDLALKEQNSKFCFTEYINKLDKVIKTNNSEEFKRDKALTATDNLRSQLNELL